MEKTKRQLRAEAVERLKNSEYHTALDDVCAMLGWGHEPHFEGATAALIDLLEDDEPPEGDAVAIMRKVANGDEVTGNAMRKEVGGTDWADALLILADMVERDYVSREKINALRAYYGAGPTAMTDEQIEAGREVYGAKKDVDMVIVDELHDSREKLEADVAQMCIHIAIGYEVNQLWYCGKTLHENISILLDRQAAITKVECENTFLNRADEIITRRELEKRELQTQIADLQVESICLGDKANAAEEMLLFLLEGGYPNWLGWYDDHDGLCDYFKERFDETVPELKERIATQKRTIESYRDDSRELQKRVDDLVAENIKLTEHVGEIEDQLAATRRELKIVQGQLTLTLNNWEQAKGKLRRQKVDLDTRALNLEERENRTAEDIASEKVEYWKSQCEKAREEAEVYRSKYGDVVDKAKEMVRSMD